MFVDLGNKCSDSFVVFNAHMCYFSDFAYPTVKDRMPIILTKVIDTVFRMKSQVGLEIGDVSKVDL